MDDTRGLDSARRSYVRACHGNRMDAGFEALAVPSVPASRSVPSPRAPPDVHSMSPDASEIADRPTAGLRRRAIVVVTRDFPFGGGEAFVEDELARLARLGPVVVLPAYGGGGEAPRALPEGVVLDRTLAARGSRAILRPSILGRLVVAGIREIAGRPSLLVHPRSLARMVLYLHRASRVLDWVRAARDAGDPPRRVMAFWSNAEAFGMALAAADDPALMLVSRSHRFDVWASENPGHYLPFREPIARHSHRLLPSSREAAGHLRRTLPVDAERVQVAPLGVEPPIDPEPRRERAGVLVVTCSTAAPVKRLPLVAESIAIAAASDSSRDWTWVHLGSGEDQIRRVLDGGPGNLRLETPGWLRREAIYAFHRDRQPDCLVNLSSSEGVPLSIMEALAMRVPVVATAAGGTGEMVDDTVGALLPVEVDAVTAGAAIRRVVDAGEALRVAARHRFEQEGSSPVAIDALRRHVPEFLAPPD